MRDETPPPPTIIHVVTRLRLRPECWLRLMQAIPSAVAATRSAPGCLDYDLYVSATRPGEVTTLAAWADAEAAAAHLATAHAQDFLALAAACATDAPTQAMLRAG